MSHIPDWISTARGIANQCRLGMTLEAGVAMASFLPLMATDVSSQIDNDFLLLISDLNKCHKNTDWLGVADCLEFELIPWFERLNSTLK